MLPFDRLLLILRIEAEPDGYRVLVYVWEMSGKACLREYIIDLWARNR